MFNHTIFYYFCFNNYNYKYNSREGCYYNKIKYFFKKPSTDDCYFIFNDAQSKVPQFWLTTVISIHVLSLNNRELSRRFLSFSKSVHRKGSPIRPRFGAKRKNIVAATPAAWRRYDARRRGATCVRFREALVNFSRARTFVKRNPTSSL